MTGNLANVRWVLGSRSPRRLELLRSIVGGAAIEVLPPASSDEAEFEGLSDWASIESRLREIVRTKEADVLGQLALRVGDGARSGEDASANGFGSRSDPARVTTVVVSADTTIVASRDDEELVVLGQPPESGDWRSTVRGWFQDFYLGRTHVAATAVRLAIPGGETRERVVRSRVLFHADGERWIEWYLETGEPRGKAGGYAIQGAGSVFVSRVEGSVSNVVGLPLREVLQMADELVGVGGERLS
ncbi:MAG: Maf family protein [Planctomycetaceae bacterium]|nr:Maf family protein [Planctomycetaceae bacterium]